MIDFKTVLLLYAQECITFFTFELGEDLPFLGGAESTLSLAINQNRNVVDSILSDVKERFYAGDFLTGSNVSWKERRSASLSFQSFPSFCETLSDVETKLQQIHDGDLNRYNAETAWGMEWDIKKLYGTKKEMPNVTAKQNLVGIVGGENLHKRTLRCHPTCLLSRLNSNHEFVTATSRKW
jgi:hypothetical protein